MDRSTDHVVLHYLLFLLGAVGTYVEALGRAVIPWVGKQAWESGVEAKEEEDMEGGNGVHRASSASLILGGWLVGTLVTCCQLQEWREMEVADWLVATAKDGCV